MTCEKLSNAEEVEIDESPCSTAKLDVTDMPSKKARVSNCDVFLLVMPIITHILDIISDINVARHYIVINEYSYFASTIIVVLVPSLINNAVSYRMRQQDREVINLIYSFVFCSFIVLTNISWYTVNYIFCFRLFITLFIIITILGLWIRLLKLTIFYFSLRFATIWIIFWELWLFFLFFKEIFTTLSQYLF